MKLAGALVPLLAPLAAAQTWTVTPLVEVGDDVPGVGAVTSIRQLAIADTATWRVEVDTDATSSMDLVVVGPGGAVLQEGQALSGPAGATLRQFNGLAVDSTGATATILSLDGTASTLDDTGVYKGSTLLVQEGDATTAPGYTPGSTYGTLYQVQAASNGDVVVLANVDDVAIPGSPDLVLMRLRTDASGALVDETALWREQDALPGTGGVVTGLLTGPHGFALNDAGGVALFADTDLPTGSDGFILVDGVAVAQEGAPSPLAGRSWQSLGGTEVSLNDSGDHAFTGVLDGDSASNVLVVRNGSKFRQEGDALAGLPGTTLTSFGLGPIDLAETGELLWYGRWSGATSNQDEGLFVENQLVVREGVTTVGGVVIDQLYGSENGYAISDDGDTVIFEARLDDNTWGVYRATRPASIATQPGCTGYEGILLVDSGLPQQGTTMQLTWSNPSAATGVRQLGLSGASWAAPNGCGIPLPGIGELLISILPTDYFAIPAGVHTGVDATLPLPISGDPAFLGVTLYLQGVYLFPADPLDPVDLTNGLSITLFA